MMIEESGGAINKMLNIMIGTAWFIQIEPSKSASRKVQKVCVTPSFTSYHFPSYHQVT